MARDLTFALNEYLDANDSDGFLYSGPITREKSDQLVRLIDKRSERRTNVKFFLTTFGGDPNAAYRIGRALKQRYENGSITILFGGYCKSAGTLISLCASELAFGCHGELGPLDTQIDKPNEIVGSDSGLDLLQAIEQITDSSFNSWEQQMLGIVRHSGGAITTKVAAEIASSLTEGLFCPISAQIDPLRLGVVKRAMQISEAYGKRLKSQNVKNGTVERLVREYPAHGFVIDQCEAEELFENVRRFEPAEEELFELLEFVLRVPAPDGREVVTDFRELLPGPQAAAHTSDNQADSNEMEGKTDEHDVEHSSPIQTGDID